MTGQLSDNLSTDTSRARRGLALLSIAESMDKFSECRLPCARIYSLEKNMAAVAQQRLIRKIFIFEKGSTIQKEIHIIKCLSCKRLTYSNSDAYVVLKTIYTYNYCHCISLCQCTHSTKRTRHSPTFLIRKNGHTTLDQETPTSVGTFHKPASFQRLRAFLSTCVHALGAA